MDSKDTLRLEIQIRTALLNFYASQLGGHSRFIIGFSVVLFSLITVRNNLVSSFPSWDFNIIYSSLLIASSVFCFLTMRYLVYGILANSATHAPIKITDNCSFADNRKEIRDFSKKSKILMKIPISYFMSIGEKKLLMSIGRIKWFGRIERFFGILICLGMGLIITYFVSLLPLKPI